MTRMPESPDRRWEALYTLLPEWASLDRDLEGAFSEKHHGDFPKWQAALATLPPATVLDVTLADTVSVDGRITGPDSHILETALRKLMPWRKGPFALFGVKIDTEWRSDWKWRRLEPHLPDLDGDRVLDVGCGNGYFGWRLLARGAHFVAGVDPGLLFCMQHQAINRYITSEHNWLIPLAFEAIPPAQFDTVLSMGVIYHRRDPLAHARRLFEFTRPGGRVVLESLVVAHSQGLFPNGRYARMRNLSIIPSVDVMLNWLDSAGFRDLVVADVTHASFSALSKSARAMSTVVDIGRVTLRASEQKATGTISMALPVFTKSISS